MNSSVERVYTRRTTLENIEAILFLMQTLLNKAEEHKETVIPGYTHHSQQAQPVTLGHFYTSAFQAFSRDVERLLDAYKRVNLSTMAALPSQLPASLSTENALRSCWDLTVTCLTRWMLPQPLILLMSLPALCLFL